MKSLEKAHYSCLCIVCHGLVELPLCNECAEECDQIERESLKKLEAADRQRKDGK